MADIEVVIKIDEVQKKMVDAILELPPQVENDLISAIRHGVPLPKEHGDLIDANVLKNSIGGPFVNTVKQWINLQPIIIKEDKAESGE